MQILLYGLIGLVAGVTAGFFGVGGGIIIVPALVFLAGMTQQQANGTSLVALLLPVGLLGVLEYYRRGAIGNQNIRVGLIIAGGLFVGALFGSRVALGLSPLALRRGFSIFLLLVAIRMWFSGR